MTVLHVRYTMSESIVRETADLMTVLHVRYTVFESIVWKTADLMTVLHVRYTMSETYILRNSGPYNRPAREIHMSDSIVWETADLMTVLHVRYTTSDSIVWETADLMTVLHVRRIGCETAETTLAVSTSLAGEDLDNAVVTEPRGCLKEIKLQLETHERAEDKNLGRSGAVLARSWPE
ncbi:hypothetical protein J6590_012414 [Homalodisca vitripennis]|nr:hypothetical protein J6590_012414 [Homalodisca vitripennis]